MFCKYLCKYRKKNINKTPSTKVIVSNTVIISLSILIILQRIHDPDYNSVIFIIFLVKLRRSALPIFKSELIKITNNKALKYCLLLFSFKLV